MNEYGCDGLNHNCRGVVPYDKVNWFNSNLGFCDRCWEKLHKTPSVVLHFCYDISDNDEIAKFICNLTK